MTIQSKNGKPSREPNLAEIPTTDKSRNTKKLLLISYVFPPMAAVGRFRAMKSCKFLPEFGWQPTVLTVKKGFNYAFDYDALDQLDPNLKIYRSGNLSPLLWWDRRGEAKAMAASVPESDNTATVPSVDNRPSLASRIKKLLRDMLSLPDLDNFWIPFGVVTGLRAIRRERVDAILSSSPPASAHVVAYILSILTRKPLMLDFRDLWTLSEGYEARQLPWIYRKIDRWLEKMIFRRASAIMAATEAFRQQLEDGNPDMNPAKLHAVINGLDADDFKGIEYPKTKTAKFTILHLGSMYGNRNPIFFFKVLSQWVKNRPEVLDRIEAKFVGNAPDYVNMLNGTPLEKVVTFENHIPHRKVLAMLWQADLLLLILGFELAGIGCMPAKAYEYIATGRPILAMLPEGGIAASKVNQYQRGLVLTSPDIETACAYLSEQFDKWVKSEGPPVSSFNLPEEFDRRSQDKKLAAILNSIV